MRKYLKWVALALTLVWCLFIWQFSLADAEASTQASNGVLESVNQVLEKINPNLEITGEEIRNSAHFGEFAVLGALLALTLWLFGFPHVTPFALLAGAVVAGVDECLQFFSPGRSPQLLDVLIDTAGALCGVLGFLALYYIVLAIMKKKKEKAKNNSKTS